MIAKRNDDSCGAAAPLRYAAVLSTGARSLGVQHPELVATRFACPHVVEQCDAVQT